MQPEVIYDQQREVAVLIDADDMRGLGPVYVGPNAEGELNAFLRTLTPAIVSGLNTFDLATASKEYWAREFAALYKAAAAPDTAPVGDVGSEGGNAAALAEREAAAATDIPPEQPADTDMGADAGAADQVTGNGTEPEGVPDPEPEPAGPVEQTCLVCNGSGQVPGDTAGTVATCALCRGSGKVVAVPSP